MKENKNGGEQRVASSEEVRNTIAARTTRGLTLIELLVVIVILTTLVGGVIPVLSPNNDTRKIRAAARGLQGYINLVQAKAARTGRPHGIAFRESSAGSGVALEVFGLEVPQPFAGFSTESRSLAVKAEQFNSNDGRDQSTAPTTYGPRSQDNPKGNGGGQFSPEYAGYDLYVLHFRFATSPGIDLKSEDDIPSDVLPPQMFRVGDILDVEGNRFLIVDDTNHTTVDTDSDVQYLDISRNRGYYKNRVVCVWLNGNGQVAPQGNKPYHILRQPTNSADAPYQLPVGIVIDMQASVAEGSESAQVVGRFPTDGSLYVRPDDRPRGSSDPLPSDTIGIMFSPTGAVDSLIFNGNELPSVSRLVLMLGRIENGGIDPTSIDLSKSNEAPWTVQNGEKAEDVQERINWLNLDSRLLSIMTSNGRSVVSEAAFVDPSLAINQGGFDGETAEIQLEAAHGFAHEMSTAK